MLSFKEKLEMSPPVTVYIQKPYQEEYSYTADKIEVVGEDAHLYVWTGYSYDLYEIVSLEHLSIHEKEKR